MKESLSVEGKELGELRANAARYLWLRDRLKVSLQKSMSGSGALKPTLIVRIGCSFFSNPSSKGRGYLDPRVYEQECLDLDNNIDLESGYEGPQQTRNRLMEKLGFYNKETK